MLSKKFFKWLLNLSKLLLFIFLVPTFFIIHNRFFRITNINCRLNIGPCPLEVSTLLTSYLSSSTITLDRSKLVEDIKKIASADRVEISLLPLRTLTVRIFISDFRVPVSLSSSLPSQIFFDKPLTPQLDTFTASASAKKYLLLSNGQLIRNNITTQTNANIIIPQGMSTKLLSLTLKTLKNLASQKISFNSIFVYPNADTAFMILKLSQSYDKVYLVLDVQKSNTDLTQTLQQIARQVTIDSTKLIDLRFKKPVIR